MNRHVRSAWLAAATLLAVAGCGPAKTYGPLAEISGTVRIDGKPLDNGTIAFVTPATGDVQVFEVSDGRFAGRARVGPRRVEFRRFAASAKQTAATDLPGSADPFQANTLPDHLNAMSTLTATVAPNGPNSFEFELRSDGSGD